MTFNFKKIATSPLAPRHDTMVLFIFLAVGLFAYCNGLSGPFMMDDRSMFGSWLKDKSIISQWVPYKAQDVSEDGPPRGESYYRPFHHTTLIIFYRLFGENYFLYHGLNLVLFCLASFCIYRLLAVLLDEPLLGFLTGLFYLLHPINGIFVNSITASAFTIQVILMSLALMYLRFEGLLYYISIGCFFLAVFSHETAMFFPLYALALWVIKEGDDRRELLKKVVPFFILIFVYFFFRMIYASLNDTLFDKFNRFHMNAGEYLASLSKVIWWYCTRLVFPQGIVILWTTAVVRSWVGFWIVALLALIALFAFLIFHFRKHKPALLGLLWFGIGFLPIPWLCLLQPMHGPMIEPHWFDFSLIGLFLFIAVMIKDLLLKFDHIIMTKIVTAILLVCVLIDWGYNYIWSDERRYCQYWYSQAPTFTSAAFHLAKVYEVVDGNFEDAKRYYQLALNNSYFWPRIYPHLGGIALAEGDWASARQYFTKAYQISPKSWEAANNLGVVAYHDGQYQEALAYFRTALELNPQAEAAQRDLYKTLKKINNKIGA